MLLQHLDVSYEPEQDRIILVVREQKSHHQFWLTRRLLRAMLGAMVTLLTQSSSVAGRAGGDVRSDILLFEHVDAIARRIQDVQVPDVKVGPAPDGSGVETRLLRQIELSARADQFSLTLSTGEAPTTSVAMSRDNAHQLISMLYDRALLAEWDLRELDWLARRGQVVLPQGVRPS